MGSPITYVTPVRTETDTRGYFNFNSEELPENTGRNMGLNTNMNTYNSYNDHMAIQHFRYEDLSSSSQWVDKVYLLLFIIKYLLFTI